MPKLRFQLNSGGSQEYCCLCFPWTLTTDHGQTLPSPLYPFRSRPGEDFLSVNKNDSRLSVDMKWGGLTLEPSDCVLMVETGLWTPYGHLPHTIPSSCLPLDSLPSNRDSACWAVTHHIVNNQREKKMTVSLVHSVPLLLSSVHVYVGANLVAVAHTVGPDTLGLLPDLGLEDMFQGVPWRAVLIKDSEGDFTVCVGGWRGMRTGRRGVPGDPGHFLMTSLNLRTGNKDTLKLNTSKTSLVDLPGLKVDWKSGKILVKKEGCQLNQPLSMEKFLSCFFLKLTPDAGE